MLPSRISHHFFLVQGAVRVMRLCRPRRTITKVVAAGLAGSVTMMTFETSMDDLKAEAPLVGEVQTPRGAARSVRVKVLVIPPENLREEFWVGSRAARINPSLSLNLCHRNVPRACLGSDSRD